MEQNLRADGRSRVDFRAITLETGLIDQTNGSARLRLANTDVLVGVKVEITTPDPIAPNEGIIKFYVECCPSASPEFEGRGAELLNLELAQSLERMMKNSSALDLKSLCIIPKLQCWIIYVDVLVLDSDGNLFDAISIATRAALFNTKIPKIELEPGDAPGQMEIVISDDPLENTRINVENVPICVTLTKIGSSFVVDATLEEELCMKARLTVGINKKGNICSMHKGGPGGVFPSSIEEMLQAARKVGLQLLSHLDQLLTFEEKKSKDQKRKLGFLAN